MSTALTVPITAETLVDDLMTTYPNTIAVFIRRRMMCIGCPVARLHDVAEACREHRVPIEDFLADVNAAARAPARTDTQRDETAGY